jgi:hypothetical protein
MDTGRIPPESSRANSPLQNWLIAAGVLGVVNAAGLFLLWHFTEPKPAPRATLARAPAIAKINEAAALPAAPRSKFPDRDPNAKPNEIDLSQHYNFVLHKNWHDVRGNDLAELPTGLQPFAGTEFDVRGVIQVAIRSEVHPPKVTGIPVGQACQRIHFLHAAIGAADTRKGKVIGRYLIYYANGETKEVPLIAKVNIGDWWAPVPDDELEVPVAWTGQNAKSRPKEKQVRLLKYTWENPMPQEQIMTIDMLAEYSGPSPFLVALTVE